MVFFHYPGFIACATAFCAATIIKSVSDLCQTKLVPFAETYHLVTDSVDSNGVDMIDIAFMSFLAVVTHLLCPT